MNDIPVLQHDWTLECGSWLVGLVGYPSGTYVCYGAGYVWVPVTVETFSFASLILCSLVGFAFWWRHRRDRERESRS